MQPSGLPALISRPDLKPFINIDGDGDIIDQVKGRVTGWKLRPVDAIACSRQRNLVQDIPKTMGQVRDDQYPSRAEMCPQGENREYDDANNFWPQGRQLAIMDTEHYVEQRNRYQGQGVKCLFSARPQEPLCRHDRKRNDHHEAGNAANNRANRLPTPPVSSRFAAGQSAGVVTRSLPFPLHPAKSRLAPDVAIVIVSLQHLVDAVI